MVKTRNRVESEANLALLEIIRAVKMEHPFWGYRHVCAYIRYHHKLKINRKRVYRLMKKFDLTVKKNERLRAKRTPLKEKIRTLEPNDVWGTDMTKIMIPDFGWAYLHVVLDWGSKMIVGFSLSERSKTEDWLDALNMAVNNQFPEGIKERKAGSLRLVSDHGCQPTSIRYAQECDILGISQVFASYGNPKGNADTERVMRTIKEDLIYPNEFSSINELRKALVVWVKKYNEEFPHSSLGYVPPYDYEQWWNSASRAA